MLRGYVPLSRGHLWCTAFRSRQRLHNARSSACRRLAVKASASGEAPASSTLFASSELPLLRRVASCTVIGGAVSAARHIRSGCVSINGEPVLDEVHMVSADDSVVITTEKSAQVTVPHTAHIYLKLHKPCGVVCTRQAEKSSSRPIVASYFPAGTEHCHNVGRLDRKSEGLLLVTSDGIFTRAVLEPEGKLEKEYLALVSCKRDGRPPPSSALAQLLDGVDLGDNKSEAVAEVADVESFDGSYARLRLVVTSGRFHMVRRMLRKIGYTCLQLIRTRIGDIAGVTPVQQSLRDAAEEAYRQDSLLPPQPPAVLAKSPDLLLPAEYSLLRPDEVESVYRGRLAWLDRAAY